MNINLSKAKIVVNIPEDYLDVVRNAILDAGAGVIGNYTHCSNTSKIIGTFKPNQDANPFLGNVGNMEYVREEKLEVQCNIKDVKRIIKVIRDVHPYEEPGIDIIPLLNEDDLWWKMF